MAALPFGYWADRGVRRTVVGVGVAIWSLATLFTGFARNFLQLFVSRAVLGIGEASYYPAGTSLLSDYFPKEQRGRVMSIWGAGSTLGIAVGFAGGGYIAEKFGWRNAFFFAAVPGILFALLAFGMREPLRGSVEARGRAVKQTDEASLRTFLGLMRIPTLRATILSQTLLYFVLASNAFWLPTLLHRRFDLSISQAGLLAGVVLVLGGLIGTLAGGWIADRLARTNPAAHLQVGIAGFLIGAVFIVDLAGRTDERRADPRLRARVPDHRGLPVPVLGPVHRRVAERGLAGLAREQRDDAALRLPRLRRLALDIRRRLSSRTASAASRPRC